MSQPTTSSSGPSGIAGGAGALAACCAVKLLILTGVLAGVSGLAVGGIALGGGVAAAAAVWLVALWLRRRRSACPTPQAARPAAEQPAGQLNAHPPGRPLPEQPEEESNVDRLAAAPSARQTAAISRRLVG